MAGAEGELFVAIAWVKRMMRIHLLKEVVERNVAAVRGASGELSSEGASASRAARDVAVILVDETVAAR